MWQGGPPLYFIFLRKKKTQKVVGTTLPHRECGEKWYILVVVNYFSYGYNEPTILMRRNI
jgi:hypothetical protein